MGIHINKIVIDPRSSFQYSSYYIKGLKNLVSWYRIVFRLSPFQQLDDLGNNFRFIIIDKNGDWHKFFIHTDDTFHLRMQDYQWCDVYGCVNTNYGHSPKHEYPKLVSLCPSYGIIPASSLFIVRMAISCFLHGFNSIIKRAEWSVEKQDHVVDWRKNIRHYWSRIYKGITQRMPYESYIPQQSEDNYIFFLSTLWYSDQWNKNDDGVNKRRACFIRACQKIARVRDITFEGGFANRSSSKSATLFAECMSEPASMEDWIKKTHRSALVFNTPAFWDCHGWKLGEYLAMGKCIISTPLSNDLPAPLQHGVNVFFAEETEESLYEAITFLLDNPDYRNHLEKGASEYWQNYGTPEASLKLLGII